MPLGPKRPPMVEKPKKRTMEPGVAGPLRPGEVRKAGPPVPSRQQVAATTAARKSRTKSPAAPAAAPSRGRAAVTPASTAAAASADNDIEKMARDQYGYMAWALDDPELGNVLREAAKWGWDEAKLKGAVFATDWFKKHGTHKVATQLKQQADAYLVPMDDQSRRNWAFKIITGEVQPTEMNDWIKEQSKGMFPHLAAAIDRGITVRDYASPYRAIAAQTLELAPEAINLNDPIWRRALDGNVDPKTNERTAMSLADWERTLKTDSTYGWDFTKGARSEASAFAAKLQETFGAR